MPEQPSAPVDVEAIAERLSAATPGPWRADGVQYDAAENGYPVLGGGEPGSMSEHMITWVGEFCNRNAVADAEFIAAARTDVEDLLALVAAQQAALDRAAAVWADVRRNLHQHTNADGWVDDKYRADYATGFMDAVLPVADEHQKDAVHPWDGAYTCWCGRGQWADQHRAATVSPTPDGER